MWPKALNNHVYIALALAVAVAMASTPNLLREAELILFMGSIAHANELAASIAAHPDLIIPP